MSDSTRCQADVSRLLMSCGSITACIADLKGGQAEAADTLWRHYFRRLVGMARARLAASPCRVADEEDVALSAFKSLCLGAEAGRFPELCDRDSLWPLLVVLTARKAQDLLKHARRQKRGGGRPLEQIELEQIMSREPTPEFAALAAEQHEQLLAQLDPRLRRIAELKLQGFSNREVATALDCGLRTVSRRLDLIRRSWEFVAGAADD